MELLTNLTSKMAMHIGRSILTGKAECNPAIEPCSPTLLGPCVIKRNPKIAGIKTTRCEFLPTLQIINAIEIKIIEKESKVRNRIINLKLSAGLKI
jgi:hypothetical protein